MVHYGGILAVKESRWILLCYRRLSQPTMVPARLQGRLSGQLTVAGGLCQAAYACQTKCGKYSTDAPHPMHTQVPETYLCRYLGSHNHLCPLLKRKILVVQHQPLWLIYRYQT